MGVRPNIIMPLGSNTSNPSNFQEIRRSFIPKFDAKQPIERDDDRIVGGTAALIFQGFAVVERTFKKTDEKTGEKTEEKFSYEALVFACLGSDGKFKNIPIKAYENVLTLAFEKMGLELSTIEKTDPFAAIPGMEGFEGTYDFDVDKLYDVFYPVRGKLFTGEMKRTKSKNSNKYYFTLNIETLLPVMVNGEHKALQKPDETKPECSDFDWDE